MEPPIQTEYLRSGGAIIFTFIDEGASAVISFCIRSEIPGYMVVPPDYSVGISQDGSRPTTMHWTYHNNVTIEILSNVDIALHNGVEGGDVDTSALKT